MDVGGFGLIVSAAASIVVVVNMFRGELQKSGELQKKRRLALMLMASAWVLIGASFLV